MAIAYGTFGGWAGQSGFGITMARPTSTTNGDFLVMIVATEADETHVTPAGWTLVQNSRNGSAASSSNVSAFYKIAANEPPNFSVTCSGNNLLGIGGVFRFTGTNVAIDQVALNTGVGTSITSGTITPTQTPSYVLYATASKAGLAGAFTPPGGFTEAGEGGFYTLTAALDFLSYSGTGATGSYTETSSSSGSWANLLFNVYEGAGGGGGGGGTAASVTFSPTGTISSTNVQSAVAEVASESVQAATLTTKGDLVAASGASSVVRVPVGANGQVLQSDSAATAGVSWVSAPGIDTSVWTSYTPTITANPTPPNIGTGGVITGHYKQIGKTLQFQLELLVGTTPSNGSGTYNFSLPGGITTANRNQSVTAWYIDSTISNNAGHYIGVGLVGASATTITAYLAGGGVNSPGTAFASGTPVSLHSGDTFVVGGTIEVQ